MKISKIRVLTLLKHRVPPTVHRRCKLANGQTQLLRKWLQVVLDVGTARERTVNELDPVAVVDHAVGAAQGVVPSDTLLDLEALCALVL